MIFETLQHSEAIKELKKQEKHYNEEIELEFNIQKNEFDKNKLAIQKELEGIVERGLLGTLNRIKLETSEEKKQIADLYLSQIVTKK